MSLVKPDNDLPCLPTLAGQVVLATRSVKASEHGHRDLSEMDAFWASSLTQDASPYTKVISSAKRHS